ncbi:MULTISPECIES: hypothetical protein [Sphingomonadales]|uniref:hypothetical protein n=1 Tax=Sphingomonadales TaxID=204457 RepID=UPI000A3E4EB3|nr:MULTISPECIES: hypothetical protein [Sphingomonadales]
MARYRNIAPGPRGGYLKGNLVEVAPGQEAELDDAPEEWFEEVDAGPKPKRTGKAAAAE